MKKYFKSLSTLLSFALIVLFSVIIYTTQVSCCCEDETSSIGCKNKNCQWNQASNECVECGSSSRCSQKSYTYPGCSIGGPRDCLADKCGTTISACVCEGDPWPPTCN